MSPDYVTDSSRANALTGTVWALEPQEPVTLPQPTWDLGIAAVAATVRDDSAIRSLEAVASSAGRERGMPVGDITVTTVDEVAQERFAGVAFTMAPGLDIDVADASWSAAILGATWFRCMKGPVPVTRVFAAGGFDAIRATDFFAAGAGVLAVGFLPTTPPHVEQLIRLAAGNRATGGRS